MSQILDMVIDQANMREKLYFNYMSLSTLIIDSPSTKSKQRLGINHSNDDTCKTTECHKLQKHDISTETL